MNFDPRTITAEQLRDPSVTGYDLGVIAQSRPDLWNDLLRHPAMHPQLAAWINSQQQNFAANGGPYGQPYYQGGQQAYHGGQPSGFAQFSNRKNLQDKLNIATIIAGVIGMLSTVFPIASLFGVSINFFHEELQGEGIALMIGFIFLIAFAAVALVIKKKWAQITSIVVAALVALLAGYDSFANIISLSNERGFSIGFGLILLGLVAMSLVTITVFKIIDLVSKKPNQGANYPQQW